MDYTKLSGLLVDQIGKEYMLLTPIGILAGTIREVTLCEVKLEMQAGSYLWVSYPAILAHGKITQSSIAVPHPVLRGRPR